jgi:hypothetical protein
MDLIFNCPKCSQELEVDAAGSGEEIDCPSCGETIKIPESNAPGVRVASPVTNLAEAQAAHQPINAIAASAAAKVERHLKVPVRERSTGESLIAKPLAPLDAAAKDTERQVRVKCIRHVDCVEVGHDKFDETVSKFLGKIGEQNIVSITTISYSHVDVASQKLLVDYGVMIVYKG